jgi:hypothetical protein
LSQGNDLLNNIRIASPCTAAWDEMQGDDRIRFCQQCRLNVYNLSAMTRQEAEALVRDKEGRLCARFYVRRDGTMLTDNCPVGFRAARRTLVMQLGAIATAFTLLLGSTPLLNAERRRAIRHSRLGQVEPFKSLFDWLDPSPRMLLGDVAIPAPPQPPPGKGNGLFGG